MSTAPQQPEPQFIPAVRRRLPGERKGITHTATIGDQQIYITVSLYEDGRPGEVFLKMDKEGSTASGLLDSLSVAVSVSLQYGIPLSVFVQKFSHTRFEPDGFTGNPEIPIAKSVCDYAFRWLGNRFPEDKH